ncbi:hypothetical protein NPIL_15741 [Nephila pilipes]|uniref:Uncharacterized protein n=1 Tax=Nephila pilipes TaxID=299642 RepID=A0A8X6PUX1_NEPPI|nr:hypothetical protein NPIL_15741 [Nephila pilipes]
MFRNLRKGLFGFRQGVAGATSCSKNHRLARCLLILSFFVGGGTAYRHPIVVQKAIFLSVDFPNLKTLELFGFLVWYTDPRVVGQTVNRKPPTEFQSQLQK